MGKLKTPYVHSAKWHIFDNISIIGILQRGFKNVSMLPNQYIIRELQILGVATLELLEDRASSSVYRIRQTGVVYQIENIEGEVFEFEDYDEYKAIEPIDQSITIYSTGELSNYIIARIDTNTLYIKRNKTPKFAVRYKLNEPLENIEFIEINDQLEPVKMAKIMRSLGTVVFRFLKEEKLTYSPR